MVIAAVKNKEDIEFALDCKTTLILHMTPNIHTLKEEIDMIHRAGKKVLLHFDLSEGIGKDKSGLLFVKNLGADGIISTRSNLIKSAKEIGLLTIQRFFIVDSHSVETTVESLKASKADMIEMMPGIIPKMIERIKERVNVPIIAGGLIETKEEMNQALNSGATAISTGKKDLWK